MNYPVNIVLVRSIYPSNIGSVSRVMANMNANRLILVNPQCEIDTYARQGAAGAQSRLENRTEYASWDEFYENEGGGIRIAFSKRNGKERKVIPLQEQLNNIEFNKAQQLNRAIYLIFGPEDHGLSADDMALVNSRCSLPTYGEFSSMNLSHAVLLASFITIEKINKYSINYDPEDIKAKSLNFPEELIKEWLSTMGFQLDDRRSSAFITLRRLLLESNPTDKEFKVLNTILQQNLRILRESQSTFS